MFIRDTPIKTANRDLLERENYAKHLGESILDWKEEESIVIALNGKWGEGKTSIVNMALEHINNNFHENTQNEDKKYWFNIFKKKKTGLNPNPTIIKYNPWTYSELNDLTTSFFTEISRELKVKNTSKKDKKIAKKLMEYAQFLRILPTQKEVVTGTSIIISALGLLGISLKEIGNWFNLSSFASSEVWTAISYFLLFIAALIVIFNKAADFFSLRSKASEKTAVEIKKELHRELSKRKKQLLIVIDDIDRLTADEVKEIFRLIKQNADFPNTIYLLPFDRNVIIENLSTSLGVSGEVYLEKIIQVQFNIPKVSEYDIDAYLSSSLKDLSNNMLDSKSKNMLNLLRSEYWRLVYTSGLVKLFNNLREVKRYISSLEFNISQLYKDDVLEVNPVDFYAIEALRIFEPNFFDFIKQNKELLTDHKESKSNNELKLRILNKAFDMISSDRRESVIRIFSYLFPQFNSLVHSNESLSKDSSVFKNLHTGLRICSSIHFNSYFSYLPKGSLLEVSEYELKLLYNSTGDSEDFEMKLNDFHEKNKFKKVLKIFQASTHENPLLIVNLENIVVPLLNMIDVINEKEKRLFNYDVDVIINFIIELLMRLDSLELKFSILADAIKKSKSLLGITKLISSLIEEKNHNQVYKIQVDDLVNKNQSTLLEKACFERIDSALQDRSLFNMKDALFILTLWRNWVIDFRNHDYLYNSINKVTEDDIHLLEFLNIFINESGFGRGKEFNIERFSAYHMNMRDIYKRLKKIDLNKSESYQEAYGELIDLVLKSFVPTTIRVEPKSL